MGSIKSTPNGAHNLTIMCSCMERPHSYLTKACLSTAHVDSPCRQSIFGGVRMPLLLLFVKCVGSILSLWYAFRGPQRVGRPQMESLMWNVPSPTRSKHC